MKTTLYKGFVLVFAISLVAMSCTKDFDKINNNPNEPALELASPKLLLPNAIESMTDRVYEIFLGHEMGNCWVQHMAKVQYTDEDRYVPRMGVINTTWSSFYAANGKDVALLKQVAIAKGYDNYKGVAIVLQSYILSVLTDLFGPVPYKDAWTGALSPKYDDQETIYRGIIASLDTANTLLDPAKEAIEGDILYNGDATLWKKFANSLRMRLILRMSAKDEAFATAELTAMFGDPAKYPVFESNADNASLIYLGSAPNNNPINENRKTRDDHRVSLSVVDLMWNNSPNMDYRLALYATNLGAGLGYFVGLPNGLTSPKAAAYNGNGLANTSKIGTYFSDATSPGVLMNYSELLFIKCEAALKGYIPGGEAEADTCYESAIYASYAQFGDALVAATAGVWANTDWTTDSLALSFYTGDNWAWDPAYSTDEKMQLIGTQKWAAMFDQGLQSWFEWRRIGYPVLTPAEDASNTSKQIPVRVMYPSDEAGRNPTSLAAGVTKLGGPDNLDTRVWWDIQDNF